jgi:hypothetical protein
VRRMHLHRRRLDICLFLSSRLALGIHQIQERNPRPAVCKKKTY